ncbi:HigA family addiction module antitoxin [Candidatus Regiella endosymbiont of Tuberolachnus salignus]|uniref:HigA family addiction module antitoxin n=1 Tax=Candidatus Regiella endosymbiont of Tuberolachnus salignus TaxID=3077956 RepID=UPI0030CB6AB8
MLDTTTREPTTVGEILQEEFLTSLGIGQEELADIMGVTRATVNRLCKGRRRLTVEEATLFSELFETTPEFWLNLQAAHDRWEAREVLQKQKRLPMRPIMEMLGRRISHG